MKFKRGDRVRKRGSKGQWHGRIVGEYSASCTPIGYAVESERETGSVQIYPEDALEALGDDVNQRVRAELNEALREYKISDVNGIDIMATCIQRALALLAGRDG